MNEWFVCFSLTQLDRLEALCCSCPPSPPQLFTAALDFLFLSRPMNGLPVGAWKGGSHPPTLVIASPLTFTGYSVEVLWLPKETICIPPPPPQFKTVHTCLNKISCCEGIGRFFFGMSWWKVAHSIWRTGVESFYLGLLFFYLMFWAGTPVRFPLNLIIC